MDTGARAGERGCAGVPAGSPSTWRSGTPPRAAPGGGDPVTHFVALDDRALIRELCGEALVGRHIMTHASEGLTRAVPVFEGSPAGAQRAGYYSVRFR